MLGSKPIRPKRKRAAGIGVTLLSIAICIHQHAPSVAHAADNPRDILIVVNTSVNISSVNLTVIKDLFLKIRIAWNNGKKVVPINPNNDQLRNDFRKRVLNMDDAAERRYWEDLKVKYGQSEPPVFSNNLKAVFKLPGSVSYVYRKDYRSNVAKIIFVVPSSGN